MGFQGVLGHEFVGVAQTGPLAGRRVVGEINCSCLSCDTCRAGRPSHCPNRSVLGILNHDGAFADFIAVPQRNLHAVPDSAADRRRRLRRTGRRGLPDSGPADHPDARIASSSSATDASGTSARRCWPASPTTCWSSASMRTSSPCCGRWASRPACSRTSPRIDRRTSSWIAPDRRPACRRRCGLVRPRGTIVLKTTVAGDQTMAWAPVVIDEVTIVGIAVRSVRSGPRRARRRRASACCPSCRDDSSCRRGRGAGAGLEQVGDEGAARRFVGLT